MKQILLLSFFLSLSILGFSQATSPGIEIFEDARIQKYLDRYNGLTIVKQPEMIYRIQIISTYNRSEANQIQGKFRTLYPSESSFLEHDGVKYIVRAGSFPSKTAAEIMLRKLRANFPSSFILPPMLKSTPTN